MKTLVADLLESAVAERPRARGRLDERLPVAVIDIGSNSVRLVVYEGATRCPTPLFNEKVLCGLGRSVAATGRLAADAMQQTLDALARFRFIARQLGAGRPWVVATAAVRDADNGTVFIARLEEICGAKVILLSGQREAELAAMGILSGFHRPDGIAGDLGGGSLELVDIGEAGPMSSVTLGLGGLKLAQRSEGNIGKATQILERDLDSVPWLRNGNRRAFYAVGGSWRNFAKLHMEEVEHPLHITHGYAISAAEAVDFSETLARGRKLRKTSLARISSARREVLPLGALTLKHVVERSGVSSVVFSVHGIREGLLHMLLPRSERQRDPLLAFCEDYATLRSRSVQHGHELCAWTDRLFEPPGPQESAEQRRLRHAACLLSDVSWRAHPDYRGEQSVDLIARASLAGVDHPGRAFLALSVCYRHIGNDPLPDVGKALQPLLPPAEQARAMQVGAAIRAIHMVSAGVAGIIGRTPVALDGRKLVLSLPKDLALLNGERLRKRLAFVGDLFKRSAEVRIESK